MEKHGDLFFELSHLLINIFIYSKIISLIHYIGTMTVPVTVQEHLIKCTHCETDRWTDIMMSSKYFHIYMLPIFPVEKEINLVCKSCNLRRYHLPLDTSIISDYQQIKKSFRHPLITYTGIAIIIGFISIIILTAVFF